MPRGQTSGRPGPAVTHRAAFAVGYPLQGDVDPEPRQIPVREARMGRVHLAEDGEQVMMAAVDPCAHSPGRRR